MTAYGDLRAAPQRHYGFILADPAWTFRCYGPQEKNRTRRDAGRYYPTMSVAEISALPVHDVAAPNCWLAMWCTWPHLREGLSVMDAWGFKYSSNLFTWFKMKRKFSPTRVFITLPNDMHIGTGYTSRKNTEFVLLGKRGQPKRLAGDVHEPIFSPVREHSRKPDEQYPRIERFAAGPFLEMNARTARPGWDQWGNEVEKFVQPGEVLTKPGKDPEEQGLFDRLRPRFSVLPGAEPDPVEDVEIPAFLKRLAGG